METKHRLQSIQRRLQRPRRSCKQTTRIRRRLLCIRTRYRTASTTSECDEKWPRLHTLIPTRTEGEKNRKNTRKERVWRWRFAEYPGFPQQKLGARQESCGTTTVGCVDTPELTEQQPQTYSAGSYRPRKRSRSATQSWNRRIGMHQQIRELEQARRRCHFEWAQPTFERIWIPLDAVELDATLVIVRDAKKKN